MFLRVASGGRATRASFLNILPPPVRFFSHSCAVCAAKSERAVGVEQSRQPLLSKLTGAELRSFASITGVNNSGTKADLVDRLVQGLGYVRLPPAIPVHRILSIDMGIKNLAFCVLDVRESDLPLAASVELPTSTPLPPRATVRAWSRIDVHQHANEVIEAFDPAHFAKLAYGLVSRTLLPFKPSHILIERQRYRSGGAAAVQEWTVRVNMFESMLHAVLRTLREEMITAAKHPSEAPFPVVSSVSPQKVAQFFVDREVDRGEDEDKVKRASRSKMVKHLKTAVAERFVRDALLFDAPVESTRQAFLAAPTKAARRRKGADEHSSRGEDPGEAPARLAKRDDLADCLLQAIAWVQWEVNRRAVLRQGYQELQGLLEPSVSTRHQYQNP